MSLDAAREQDEAFWQQQEQRIQGCLGQPCCTLSGICSVLMSMAGRFAVVIHGERDCANSFHLHQGPAAANFFCTCLTEQQVTTGAADAVLADCLAQLTTQKRPEAVLVLGSCMIEMLGERFEQTVAQAADASGIPMRALHTSGLRLGSQADMLDWLFEELASLEPIQPTDPTWLRMVAPLAEGFRRAGRRFDESCRQHERLTHLEPPRPSVVQNGMNLIGLPEMFSGRPTELAEVLTGLDLEINGLFPFQACLDDWRSIGSASCSVVADRSLFPRLCSRIEALGQRVLEVPLPIGIEQTERFYALIAEAFERSERLAALLDQRRRPAQASVDAFAARFGGLRMAMGIRMLNNYRADQLAYEGLGDARALTELGLDLTLLVQGPPEEQARQRFATRLAQLGCQLPFEVFPDPWNLSEKLATGRYDVAYLADHSREEAAKAGVPMIVSRGLRPYFAGVPENVQTLTHLLAASGVGR